MCIWSAQNNREANLQFFLFLKLIYPSGKSKLTQHEIHGIRTMMNFSDIRPIKKHIQELIEIKWITYNNKTGFFIFSAFDKIRENNNWESRVCVHAKLSDLNQFRAFIGATIYAYLHKDFWRKVKREKRVCLRGRTYHFLSPSFNYLNQPAPIALDGVEQIFQISKSKASLLKRLAHKAGYIVVTPDYEDAGISPSEAMMLQKTLDQSKKTLFRKGDKYVFRSIDLILPKIDLFRRHKLGI